MRKSLRKVIASLLAVALMVGTWSNGSVTALATADGANPVVQNPVVEEPEVEVEEEEPATEEPEAEEVEQNTEADVVVVVEDTTPALSDDLVEIEDEDTPLANLDAKDGNGPIFWILLAGLMATVTLFIFFVILRRKKEEEDEELA